MLDGYVDLFGSVAGAISWLSGLFLLWMLCGLWLYRHRTGLGFTFWKKGEDDIKHSTCRTENSQAAQDDDQPNTEDRDVNQ